MLYCIRSQSKGQTVYIAKYVDTVQHVQYMGAFLVHRDLLAVSTGHIRYFCSLKYSEGFICPFRSTSFLPESRTTRGKYTNPYFLISFWDVVQIHIEYNTEHLSDHSIPNHFSQFLTQVQSTIILHPPASLELSLNLNVLLSLKSCLASGTV